MQITVWLASLIISLYSCSHYHRCYDGRNITRVSIGTTIVSLTAGLSQPLLWPGHGHHYHIFNALSRRAKSLVQTHSKLTILFDIISEQPFLPGWVISESNTCLFIHVFSLNHHSYQCWISIIHTAYILCNIYPDQLFILHIGDRDWLTICIFGCWSLKWACVVRVRDHMTH